MLVTCGSLYPPSTMQLVKRIPKSHADTSSETRGRYHSGRGIPSDHRNIQSNALQHWHKHMMQRRQQQGLLSGELMRVHRNLHQMEIKFALLLLSVYKCRDVRSHNKLIYHVFNNINNRPVPHWHCIS